LTTELPLVGNQREQDGHSNAIATDYGVFTVVVDVAL